MNHGWEKKRLGDVCEYNRGLTYSKDAECEKSSNIVLRANNINLETHKLDFEELKFLHDDYSISPKYKLQKDSILICMSSGSTNHLGKVAFVDRAYDYAYGGFMGLILPKINPKYLFLFMISDLFRSYLDKLTNGININNLKFSTLQEICIPVPPLEFQETIVSELNKINELIEVKRSQLADLDLLAQSLFYVMFGDPIENPKGWKISKVSEILETGSGGTPSKSVDEFWSSKDIPWIGSNMCQNKILYETDGKFISKHGLEKSSAKLLEPDTILIALVGATIGKVALLKIPTSTNQNIGFIKPDKNIINPIFLFYTIQGLYSLFLEIGNGKFKMANLSFIRNLPIIIPPISLQNEFGMRIEAIEDQKKRVESSITDLQTLLANRMDYWFND